MDLENVTDSYRKSNESPVAVYLRTSSPSVISLTLLYRLQVVLVAPMFAPNTSGLPNALVGAIAWGVTKLGQGHRQDNGFTLGH